MRLSPFYFDPQKRAASVDLNRAIEHLTAHLEQREADLGLRRRARKPDVRRRFRLAAEVIASNFVWAAVEGCGSCIAVPRSSGMMWARGRYANPVYGQHFLDALDLFAHPAVCLLEQLTGGFRLPDGRSQPTTLRPTAAFFHFVPRSLAGPGALVRAAEPEVLVLKGPKDPKTGRAEVVDYADTALTKRRRKEVERINRTLQAAPVWLVNDEGSPLWTSEGQPIDSSRRTLRRIFNEGSWHKGGRLFDGFWESMRREDRFRYLRIGTAAHPEGEAVANVDFGQLFPTLAYHEVGCPAPEGDLYDLAGDGTSRAGWKKLVNAALFAPEPLTRWPLDTVCHFPGGMKLRDAITAIHQRHASISPLFGTGIGFRLMMLESEILLLVLADLLASGITALPLHDSVLVGRSEAPAARAAMGRAYGHFANARARITIDFGETCQ